MAPDANPAPHDDEARFAAISAALSDAVEVAVPRWIERLVLERVSEWRGDVPDEAAVAAAEAGQAAAADVSPRVRALLGTDVDQQRTNPLALLRGATRHAQDVLADLGAPIPERDEFERRSFPDDVYGLTPATWSDIDPSLHEIGITWGAAKAYIHKARHRDEDRS